MSPADARQIRDALHDAYAQCETRADFLVIVLDALDQADATHIEQIRIHNALGRWDQAALSETLEAWIASGK